MIDIIPNWHPIFVHFTIGLLAASVAFYVLSLLLPVSETLKMNWQTVARWCLWSGMFITLGTLVAGYLAYNSVAHDTPSHAAMTEHRNWAFATAAAFAVLTLWSIWSHLKQHTPSILFVIFAIVSGGLLASTGWHGGEAVYRYGLGVMSLPKSSGEGHAHKHAAGSEHGSSSTANTMQPMQPTKPSTQTKSATDEAHHGNDQPHAH